MGTRRLPRLLLQSPTGDRGVWLQASELVEILVAEEAGRVREIVAAAEAATRRGCYAVGFLTYECAPGFDPGLVVRRRGSLPAAWFAVVRRLDELAALPESQGAFRLGAWQASLAAHEHADRVAAIRRAIERGDTYQANLTYRLRAPFTGDPLALFHRLWDAQRPSHAAYLDLGDHALLSVSPELFFSRDGERVRCRPMKGTAGRGRTTDEDARIAARLRASTKDRAENLMIVDMVRNDLGRVAAPGSVTVPELFTLERYPSLWQLTSTVEARTTAATGDILAALFPSASITGAPKRRTMELLHRLEDSPRGIYTGAIGWLAPDDATSPRGVRGASFNVAIRTVHIDRTRGIAEYGTGGGIVWDSRSGAELEETRTKAAIVLAPTPAFELLETLAWRPRSGYRLLRRHLARLADSAAHLDIPCDLDRCVTALDTLAGNLSPAAHRVRLRLAADGEPRVDATLDVPAPPAQEVRADAGRAIPADRDRAASAAWSVGRFSSIAAEPPSPEAAGLRAGRRRAVTPRPTWRVAFATRPVDPADRFLFHKTTRRELYDGARAGRPDHDDVLLWNPTGEVTESTIANLMVRLDGAWLTPSTACGLLPGTFRAALLARGRVREARLSIASLRRAERVLLVNSVRGIVTVEIDWATAPRAGTEPSETPSGPGA